MPLSGLGGAQHRSRPCHWSWEGPEATTLKQWTERVPVKPCEVCGRGPRASPASPGPQVTEAARICRIARPASPRRPSPPQSQPACPHAVVLQMAILRCPVFTPWAFWLSWCPASACPAWVNLLRECRERCPGGSWLLCLLTRASCHHLDRGRLVSWDRAQPEAWADTAPLCDLWVLDPSPFGASLTCPFMPRPHAFPACNEPECIGTQGGVWGCLLGGRLRVPDHNGLGS